jgi:hypothetical protein
MRTTTDLSRRQVRATRRAGSFFAVSHAFLSSGVPERAPEGRGWPGLIGWMKAQIRAKSRNRGRDWAVFPVRIKKQGVRSLVRLVAGDALRRRTEKQPGSTRSSSSLPTQGPTLRGAVENEIRSGGKNLYSLTCLDFCFVHHHTRAHNMITLARSSRIKRFFLFIQKQKHKNIKNKTKFKIKLERG